MIKLNTGYTKKIDQNLDFNTLRAVQGIIFFFFFFFGQLYNLVHTNVLKGLVNLSIFTIILTGFE